MLILRRPTRPRPSPCRQTQLPTTQNDGVVWAQAIVGNTVYAGGSFANARPAGAAAGTNLTPRANMLSYDITTGNLNTSFAPNPNAQVEAVAASPDGSRVYSGGDFTQSSGVNRYRIAAYNATTGALITTFAPGLNGGCARNRRDKHHRLRWRRVHHSQRQHAVRSSQPLVQPTAHCSAGRRPPMTA